MKLISAEVMDTGLMKQLRKLPRSATVELQHTIQQAAEDVRNEMLRSMKEEQKSGRMYPIKPKGQQKSVRYYRASAPGEAPAVRSGNLQNSIHTEYDDKGLTAYVGVLELAKVDYAAYLEYGTRKMEPRPFIEPALEKNKDQIAKKINDAVDRALKNA